MNIRKLAWMTLTALAFVSCATEDIEKQTVPDGTIRFAPKMVNDWNAPWTTRTMAENNATVQTLQGAEGLYLHTIVTRGIQRNNDVTRGTKYIGIDDGNSGKTFDITKTFRVSGYRYASNSNVSDVTSANLFNNDIVGSDHGVWKISGQTYVMPAATDKIDFFAWFVADEETSGVTAINAAGGLQLSYSVPTDINNQPDLLTAATRGESYNADPEYAVPLAFAHQLTAVNFVLDDNVAPGTITEIAFMNVYTGGTLSIGEGISGTWSLTNAPTETAYSMDFPTVDTGGELRIGETLIANLMMIPQTFSTTQKIRIYITVDGVEKTLFADLKNTRWEPGTTVTYKISTSSVNMLHMGVVTYPTSWSTASTENSDIKSAYANGDEIGVFGVDQTGKVVQVNEPIKLTVNGWSGDIIYNPNHTYYFYFPYQSDGLTNAPGMNDNVLVNEVLPTAAQFFTDAVTSWTPAADQSTAGALNMADLQIGKGSMASASTVNLTMAHTMGLTSLTLESKSVPTTRYYEVNGTVSSTSYIDSDDETSITSSENFAASNIEGLDNTKMLKKGKTYYYIQNPTAISPVINSSATGNDTSRWKEAVTLTTTTGVYTKDTAKAYRDHIYKGLYYTYRSTETSQSFTAEVAGTYAFECWGAAGGSATNGGYTYGEIDLTAGRQLFIYTGEKGDDKSTSKNYNPAISFNGGGKGSNTPYTLPLNDSPYVSGSGGGATDVRTYDSGASWSDFTGRLSRIMVAGGGGGQAYAPSTPGAGGGLSGLNSTKSGGSQGTLNYVYGGSQTAGGSSRKSFYTGSGTSTIGGDGSFGQGGNGAYQNHPGGGGGGGYFGGAGGAGGAGGVGGVSGAGGSSFISGMTGCQAYEASSTSSNLVQRTGTNATIHHSGLKFNSSTATTIDGAHSMPCPTGGSETGHAGHGYCRIKTPVID